ncbi:hypothetical protein DID88_009280 [Monilinia fructigena]|uniref:FAD-binding FR-type domain-containing protein n=1 Tax=Monilinia fructigena TaxID=38457 RepID=A0A395IF78_9HELO|nr:hypothetical protein DID88_009280 [Monilinia fructigena]
MSEKAYDRMSTGSVRVSERSRWPPLTRMLMSGEMTAEMPRELTMREKFDRWMVNEGYRRFFVFVFALIHVMVFTFGFLNYQLKDSFGIARSTFSITYAIARSAALTLHFDVAMILFPVCRTLISLARQTPLNGIVQFDKNITFHMTTAWSIVFFSWVHTIAHWNNFAQISAKNNLGIGGFLLANFVSGPGWTGYVMLVALMAMAITSYEKYRRANFERFWYTHHFFVIFFVFCVGTSAIGVFWQYWMYGGYIYLAERIAREIRGKHKTYVSKVVQHPSNVCEIQIKKENTKTRAGQYIFFCCPEVSIYQYHPFTLTSAPEEDYISIHIRMVGDFTRAVGKALGCEFDKPKDGKGGSQVVGVNQGGPESDGVDPAIRRILPRVYVDGPFRFCFRRCLQIRSCHALWCRIEIHTYLTAKIKVDDATNIMINDANADRDAITGLRAPTNFGRPNWDMIFKSVRKIHSPSEAGVFFCGPKVLGSQLHIKCNMYSEPGFNFCWGKENF